MYYSKLYKQKPEASGKIPSIFVQRVRFLGFFAYPMGFYVGIYVEKCRGKIIKVNERHTHTHTSCCERAFKLVLLIVLQML